MKDIADCQLPIAELFLLVRASPILLTRYWQLPIGN
jgi:hypothetical protein